MDFDEFTPQLTEFLEHHRKQEKRKRDLKKTEGSVKKKRKESMEGNDVDDENESQIDDESPMKRKKIDESMETENSVDESMEMNSPAKSVTAATEEDGNDSNSDDEDESEG